MGGPRSRRLGSWRHPVTRAGGVVVVGGGIAGLSTAFHLALAGARVTLIERESSVGRGSSAKSAGILRTVLEVPGTGELAARGAELLRHPPAELGASSFVDPVGLLLVAHEEAPAAALEQCLGAFSAGQPQARVEALDSAGALALAPRLAAPPTAAFHLPEEGHLRVPELLGALESALTELGVPILRGQPVTELLIRAENVEGVRLGGGRELEAEAVCLATGGFANALAAEAGSPLRFLPTRRHLVVQPGPKPSATRSSVVWNSGPEFYSRWNGDGWMLCACDEKLDDPTRGEPADSTSAADVQEVERTLAAALKQLRAGTLAAGPTRRAWSGLRTFARADSGAADMRFTLGGDPALTGLFWCAGLGGHGMTCGLAAGEVTAELILGRRSRPPAGSTLQGRLRA